MARHKRRTTDAEPMGLVAGGSRRTSGAAAPPPDVGPLKVSPVYDTYWRFAAERQRVFFNRFERRKPIRDIAAYGWSITSSARYCRRRHLDTESFGCIAITTNSKRGDCYTGKSASSRP